MPQVPLRFITGLLMVPRLRRRMPPAQLRKADLGTQEFWQSRLIRQSNNPTKFSAPSADKKLAADIIPCQAFVRLWVKCLPVSERRHHE
jgi:hypothetical protein